MTTSTEDTLQENLLARGGDVGDVEDFEESWLGHRFHRSLSVIELKRLISMPFFLCQKANKNKKKTHKKMMDVIKFVVPKVKKLHHCYCITFNFVCAFIFLGAV